MTGIFLRIKRGDKFETLEIEDLTEDELKEFAKEKDHEWLVSCIGVLCRVITNLEVYDGI